MPLSPERTLGRSFADGRRAGIGTCSLGENRSQLRRDLSQLSELDVVGGIRGPYVRQVDHCGAERRQLVVIFVGADPPFRRRQ